MADRKILRAGFALCIALGWLSVVAPERAAAATDGCDAAKALALIGQQPPDDAKVKAATGALVVRRVAPGDAATLDYQPNRITIEIERGRIVMTRCG